MNNRRAFSKIWKKIAHIKIGMMNKTGMPTYFDIPLRKRLYSKNSKPIKNGNKNKQNQSNDVSK